MTKRASRPRFVPGLQIPRTNLTRMAADAKYSAAAALSSLGISRYAGTISEQPPICYLPIDIFTIGRILCAVATFRPFPHPDSHLFPTPMLSAEEMYGWHKKRTR